MRLSSIDAVWFGLVFGSFISSFSTFPGVGGSLKSKIQLSSAWLGLSFAIMWEHENTLKRHLNKMIIIVIYFTAEKI